MLPAGSYAVNMKGVGAMPSYGISDQGLRRSSNQDSYAIWEDGEKIVGIVCDGIGGNRAGDVASALATETFINIYKDEYRGRNKEEFMHKAVEKINTEVFNKSISNMAYNGMGTTLVGFVADKDDTYVVNVGDSRAYALIDKKLVQITVDHTLINELVYKRGYTYQQAAQLTSKNVISRAIGIMAHMEADVFKVDEDYDYLLICSDGLHSYVDDETIEKILSSRKSLKTKCNQLIDKANEAGGLDNVTVVIYQR